jgi:hypothetical protein
MWCKKGWSVMASFLALCFLLSSCAGPTQTTHTTVSLRDGSTHHVETVRGLPVPFSNRQIRVRDLGITAELRPDTPESFSFVRVLVADLFVKGWFSVTVTTPLDPSAHETLTASGPGRITLTFFPQAKYPQSWEGIDAPGTHWFPFHFAFADDASGTRFEFTQWAQMDDQTWREAQDMVEQARRKMLNQ